MNQTPNFSSFVSPNSLPAAAPAPLHDIVGPVSFFSYTPTQLLLGAAFLVLLGIGLFFGIKKWRQKKSLTPRQAALEALTAMKNKLMEGSDHEFGILVSGLLRSYLGMVFGLAAPRQTTEEFLESLRHSDRFTSAEQESLKLFLEKSDLLKFAGGRATQEDRHALIRAAEHFIQGG
ncbi:MAG: DUF4381 domain-containing protein [Chthoniobacterales bacterium]|nr:DUF4381 domain-containing protein [Chthoniobacterales bacterium]